MAQWYRICLPMQEVQESKETQEMWVPSLGWEIPRRREWLPTLVFLPGEFHAQRSLAGYSPWGCKIQSHMTEHTLIQ